MDEPRTDDWCGVHPTHATTAQRLWLLACILIPLFGAFLFLD